MGNNFYDDNEIQYKNVIESLKNLSKIKTPENFEYNLMVKIQNMSSEVKSDKSLRKFWISVSSAAFVVTLFLIFFIFKNSNSVTDNLVKSEPETREFAPSGISNNSPISEPTLVEQNKISKEKVSESAIDKKDLEVLEHSEVVLHQDDAITSKELELNMESAAGIELDKYLNSKRPINNNSPISRLVSGSNSRASSMDELTLKRDSIDESVKSQKTKVDSISKSQKIEQKSSGKFE